MAKNLFKCQYKCQFVILSCVIWNEYIKEITSKKWSIIKKDIYVNIWLFQKLEKVRIKLESLQKLPADIYCGNALVLSKIGRGNEARQKNWKMTTLG